MNRIDWKTIIDSLGDQDEEVQKGGLHILKECVMGKLGNETQWYEEMKENKKQITQFLDQLEGDNKKYLYDILSISEVLGENNLTLEYRVRGNVIPLEEINHQYVKKLVGCMMDKAENGGVEEYENIIEPIVQFLISHNSEVETIDFLVEISALKKRGGNNMKMCIFENEINEERQDEKKQDEVVGKSYFDILYKYIDKNNKRRIMLYLKGLSKFYDIDDVIMRLCEDEPARYLIWLIKSRGLCAAAEYVQELPEGGARLQCVYILARNSIRVDNASKAWKKEEIEILQNVHLHSTYCYVASAMEVLVSKRLDQMFKGLDIEKKDSAAITNALVHFGYGRDPVFFPHENDPRVKEEYQRHLRDNISITTVGSVGLIHAFNSDAVTQHLHRQIFEIPEAGAVLAYALAAHRNGDPDHTILQLLTRFLRSGDANDVLAMLMGIATTYAGAADPVVYDCVFPMLSSPNNDIALFAIYVLGTVFPGDMDMFWACCGIFNELKKQNSVFVNYAILGMALFFYNRRDPNLLMASVPGTGDVLDDHVRVLALGFAYIGTGDSSVLDYIFSRTLVGKIDALMESLGFVAAALISVGDNVAQEFTNRLLTSALLLDSPHLRNIIPLCIAILYASNPRPEIVDTLERLINSNELPVNSIIAYGVVAAGSCSARVLQFFTQNFHTFFKDPKASFALLYAQGLVNLGKGLCTLSPLAYCKNIVLQRSIVSLVSTLFLFLEPDMFKEFPYLFYLITNAIVPKYVHMPGSSGVVRVGKPVDVTGLVGSPNDLSAVVVHTLPVILNENECAKTEDLVYTPYIEDIIIKM